MLWGSVPETVLKSVPLVVPVWRKGTSSKLSKTGEQIEIFGLFKDVMSVDEAVGSLRSSVLKLRKHIYVAYCQWQKSRTAPSKLCHWPVILFTVTSGWLMGKLINLLCASFLMI